MFGRKFYFGDNIAVGVRDLNQAVAWYKEKLGLRLTLLRSENFDAFLAFGKEDETGLALIIVPPGENGANVEPHPILFTKKIEAVYQEFAAKGISVGEIQTDSGGNRFFRFRDLEGNEIEVCVRTLTLRLKHRETLFAEVG